MACQTSPAPIAPHAPSGGQPAYMKGSRVIGIRGGDMPVTRVTHEQNLARPSSDPFAGQTPSPIAIKTGDAATDPAVRNQNSKPPSGRPFRGPVSWRRSSYRRPRAPLRLHKSQKKFLHVGSRSPQWGSRWSIAYKRPVSVPARLCIKKTSCQDRGFRRRVNLARILVEASPRIGLSGSIFFLRNAWEIAATSSERL